VVFVFKSLQIVEIEDLMVIYNFLQINAFDIFVCGNYKHYGDLQLHDTFCYWGDLVVVDIIVFNHIFSKCNYNCC
jgi:hypothetical protein